MGLKSSNFYSMDLTYYYLISGYYSIFDCEMANKTAIIFIFVTMTY